MSFLEKCAVKFAQASTSVLMIGGSMSLFYFFLSVAKSHIAMYDSTIGSSFGFSYVAIAFSIIGLLVYVLSVFDERSYRSISQAFEYNQERLFKVFSMVFMANVLLNCIVPGFYPESYLTSLSHYAPFALSNFGMVASLASILLAVKVYFSFDNWYFVAKSKIQNYFANKKQAKLMKQKQIKESIKANEEKPLQEVSSLNMAVFNIIKNTIPSKNTEFLDCLNSLQQTVAALTQESNKTDIEVENEVNLLLEQNLPKVAQVYLSAQTEEDKKEVLKAFSQMDSYFKNFQKDIDDKKKFKNNLNVASELKYISEKYGV